MSGLPMETMVRVIGPATTSPRYGELGEVVGKRWYKGEPFLYRVRFRRGEYHWEHYLIAPEWLSTAARSATSKPLSPSAPDGA